MCMWANFCCPVMRGAQQGIVRVGIKVRLQYSRVMLRTKVGFKKAKAYA